MTKTIFNTHVPSQNWCKHLHDTYLSWLGLMCTPHVYRSKKHYNAFFNFINNQQDFYDGFTTIDVSMNKNISLWVLFHTSVIPDNLYFWWVEFIYASIYLIILPFWIANIHHPDVRFTKSFFDALSNPSECDLNEHIASHNLYFN